MVGMGRKTQNLQYEQCKRHYKEVVQYDLQYKEVARYKSVTETAKIIGCSKSAISKCCTRVNKTCQGYIFLYVEDIEKEREVS